MANIVDEALSAYIKHRIRHHDDIAKLLDMCPADHRDALESALKSTWMLTWVRYQDAARAR